MIGLKDKSLPTAKPAVKDVFISVSELSEILTSLMGGVSSPKMVPKDSDYYGEVDLKNIVPDCRDDSIWWLLIDQVMQKLEDEVGRAFQGYMTSQVGK
jgi:hypothetical protein